MSPDELLSGFDSNKILGELTEISEVDHNRLFQQALKDAQQAIDAARKKAEEKSIEITLDASRLSGTNGFDSWLVKPGGIVERRLEPFENVRRTLQAQSPGPEITRGEPAHPYEDAKKLFARIAYNGLWSPSGTNWQPIRTIVIDEQEASSHFAMPIPTPAMVVLTRDKYSSILGDVAGLCGIGHDPHAEHIDLGIWMQVALLTAKAHAWSLGYEDIRGKETAGLVRILRERPRHLPEASSAAALELAESIDCGQHVPSYVLFPRLSCQLPEDQAAPALLSLSQFDRLIEARSTQRVASPSGQLSQEDMESLWDSAMAQVSAHWAAAAENLSFFSFTKTDQIPAAIGKAMKNGLEGPGGLLSKITVENIRTNLENCPPESEPIEAGSLPEHLLRALQSGQYRLSDGLLLDHRKRPLTPLRLMKLVRMLAKSFGRFFLSFQNTHPVLGIIMVRQDLESTQQLRAYEYAGRLAAHMSALARARGWVSIIKSGPVEIARDEIQNLMAQHAPNQEKAQAIREGKLKALLTFQLGLPLGPFELVSEGMQGQHNGLLERKLDKRAGRASIRRHHIPL